MPTAGVEAHEILPGGAPSGRGTLYALTVPLTDQRGRATAWDAHRGHPVLVSMFYGSCGFACPTLIRDVKRIDDALSPRARAELRVLLVSFDAARDTPMRLTELTTQHRVDGTRWTLAATDEDHARELSAVLGIKYKRLEGGNFNHSSIITLLDREGNVAHRVEGLKQDPAALVARIEALVAPP